MEDQIEDVILDIYPEKEELVYTKPKGNVWGNVYWGFYRDLPYGKYCAVWEDRGEEYVYLKVPCRARMVDSAKKLMKLNKNDTYLYSVEYTSNASIVEAVGLQEGFSYVDPHGSVYVGFFKIIDDNFKLVLSINNHHDHGTRYTCWEGSKGNGYTHIDKYLLLNEAEKF